MNWDTISYAIHNQLCIINSFIFLEMGANLTILNFFTEGEQHTYTALLISYILDSSPIPGGAIKREQSVLGLCSDQQLSFYTLQDRASFPHYNNSKIIKFGWELFIFWEVSYGLSFPEFAISLSVIVPRNSGNLANPENAFPSEITHKIKSSKPNFMTLVLL